MKKLKYILSTAVLLGFVIVTTNASEPYVASDVQVVESDFPRIRSTLSIDGDVEGLLPRHFKILEGERENNGPLVLIPPRQKPEKIDVHVLLDTHVKNIAFDSLIRSNLQGFFNHLFETDLDVHVVLSSFDGSVDYKGSDLEALLKVIEGVNFDTVYDGKIDGFRRIGDLSAQSARDGSQKIMLIANGSAFLDHRLDGVTGSALKKAIADVTQNNELTFILGHPLRSIHGIGVSDPVTVLADFSHAIPGGYLGGFGSDLTSLIDMILSQNENEFGLQYYTSYLPGEFEGAPAQFLLEGHSIHQFNYENEIQNEIIIHHVPENEIILDDSISLEIELENKEKTINGVEVEFKNADNEQASVSLVRQVNPNVSGRLKYEGKIPEHMLSADYFTYRIKVHTPYRSIGGEGVTASLPIHLYDDGIVLTAELIDDENVLWTWSGSTVDEGKSFEVWMGDELLETTSQKSYIIPLNDCNHYQIMQIKVIFEDNAKSNPSRPYEFYADLVGGGTLTEKDGVELMFNCIEDPIVADYAQFTSSTPEFNPDQNLDFEPALFYFSKLIHSDVWHTVELDSGYYGVLYYIMNFINKDQYVEYDLESTELNRSLIYKLITRVNHTEDIDSLFERALDELSARLRGNLSL